MIYGVAWFRQKSPSFSRLLFWVAGVAAFAISTSPWMETLASETFTGHMVQHLLMIVLAAPLLVFAEPLQTIQGGWPALRWSSRSERALASRWRRIAPLLAPALFVAVLFVTHLTGIYDAALNNRFLHDAEHVAYVMSAVLLWVAVRGAGTSAAVGRVGTAFAVIAGSAILGIVLLSASTPLFETYAERLGPVAALDDQRVAASLMWVGGMATTLPLLLVAVWRWASTEEQIADRAERLQSEQAARERLERDESQSV
ncbi:MAG: cytochrome c oxidase assembly protein [Actinobacteria bacterium]|nr:cytochrome c oxidase assembly protein [Actinomycetota bacterium]